MNNISAKIIADSINNNGNRITTFLLIYPRIIHAELMTHRLFSRSSSSSRAVPFEKMLKEVTENPFIPIAFQRNHKGMQGTEYAWDYETVKQMETIWLKGRDKSIEIAKDLYSEDVTKQLCNRLLEPYLYHTVLVTATEWDNWFELRCPKYSIFSENLPLQFKSKKELLEYVYKVESPEFKNQYDNLTTLDWFNINKSQAEIHIQDLAEKMYDCYNENKPNLLNNDEWHIPFNDKINNEELSNINCIKIATARCARLSYMTFDNKIDYVKDLELHDRLLESKHYSPFEHVAKAMNKNELYKFNKTYIAKDDIETTEIGWCRNFKGFIPYRHLVD